MLADLTRSIWIDRFASAFDPWLGREEAERILASRRRALEDHLERATDDERRCVREVLHGPSTAVVELPEFATRSHADPRVFDALRIAVREGTAESGPALAWLEWALRWVETHLFETARADSRSVERGALLAIADAGRTGQDLRHLNCLLRAGDVLARTRPRNLEDLATCVAVLGSREDPRA